MTGGWILCRLVGADIAGKFYREELHCIITYTFMIVADWTTATSYMIMDLDNSYSRPTFVTRKKDYSE